MQRAMRAVTVGICTVLAALGIQSHSFAHPSAMEEMAASTDWQKGYTLILMSSTDVGSANQARDYVVSKGGRIAILTPPHIMLGWVPPKRFAELQAQHGIDLVTTTAVDLSTLAYQDEKTLAIASFFNSVAMGTVTQEAAFAAAEEDFAPREPLGNDSLPHPRLGYESLPQVGKAAAAPPPPGNSDSMTGTVAVMLFFVQSNGAVDPKQYVWTADDQQGTIGRAAAALSWWSQQAPLHGASVSFTLDFYSSTSNVTQTSYEPILHSSNEDNLWINEIMSKLGHSSSDDHRARVTEYNGDLRKQLKTDWAYSAFIGYNPDPAPTQFKDALSAYAYSGGPYLQILFRNDGWKDVEFNKVFAHETGHIFWACDEYKPSCTSSNERCSTEGPRPTIPNGNCEVDNPNAVECVMRSNVSSICDFTVRQIGWGSTSSP